MTTKDNNKREEKQVEHSETNGNLKEHRTIHHVNPLGLRILVRIPDSSSRTDGGLYLPETAKDSLHESVIAEVVSVAQAVDSDTEEEANISGIPLGAMVLIEKEVGIKVPWDDSLRIVETQDVLATVEKIELS